MRLAVLFSQKEYARLARLFSREKCSSDEKTSKMFLGMLIAWPEAEVFLNSAGACTQLTCDILLCIWRNGGWCVSAAGHSFDYFHRLRKVIR